ncbi:MAG: hypothetical protein ACI9MB_001226 [Verrucomicrobiales bacterium]|jgi:hypothetical protein
MHPDLPPRPSCESLVAMCPDEPEKAADLILLLWDKVEKLTTIVETQRLQRDRPFVLMKTSRIWGNHFA